jgi:hypothetical protein
MPADDQGPNSGNSAGNSEKPRGKPFAPGTSGNPKGRPRADAADPVGDRISIIEGGVRLDAGGWGSILTGFNSTRDKRTSFTFVAEPLTDDEAQEQWRGDDVVAKVVEILPSDAMRDGFGVKTSDKQESAAIRRALDRLEAGDAIRKAAEYERAYGGAAIFPLINDGAADLAQPLNLARAQAITELVVLEPRELQPHQWDNGRVAVWRLQKLVEMGAAPLPIFVHASRLVVFPGIKVTDRPVNRQFRAWGDSVLMRMQKVLRDYGIAWDAAGALLVDFSQGVFTMDGLNDLIARDKNKVVLQRLQIADLARSVMKMLVVDAKDRFERKATPMSGLPELLDRFGQRLSAAMGMPITKLLGVSAAGLNATGEGDAKNWNAVVAAYRSDRLASPVRRLVEMLLHCKDGPTDGEVPESWSIEWCPLDTPTPKEQADTRKVVAETDAIYAGIGALTPDVIAKNRWGGDSYSPETQVDFEDQAALDAPAQDPEALDATTPAAAMAASGASVQSTAMNGAQVAALVDIVAKVGQKLISGDSARAILAIAFPVSKEQANAVIGPAEKFEAAPPAGAAPGGPAPAPGKVPVEGHTRGGVVVPPHARETPAAPPEVKTDAWDDALRLDYSPDQARAENGQFGEGGGGGTVGSGNGAGSSGGGSLEKLNPVERQMYDHLAQPRKTTAAGDRAIAAKLGLSQGDAIKMAQTIREKLGFSVMTTFRDHAKSSGYKPPKSARADASESMFFARENEYVDPGPRADHVEHRGGKWFAVSTAGTPLGGPYDTEAEADERLRQVEAVVAAKRADYDGQPRLPSGKLHTPAPHTLAHRSSAVAAGAHATAIYSKERDDFVAAADAHRVAERHHAAAGNAAQAQHHAQTAVALASLAESSSVNAQADIEEEEKQDQ